MKTIPDYKNSSKPAVLFEFPKTDFDFDLILELVVTTSHFCNSDEIQNSPWARVFSIKSRFLATIIKLLDTVYAAVTFNTLKNRFRASMLDAETNSRTKLTGHKKWGGGEKSSTFDSSFQ